MASAKATSPPLMETALAFECSVCLGPFNQPKILPRCGHSVCLNCLSQMLVGNQGNTVKCPECRAESRLGKNGVQGLKSNVQLERAVGVYLLERKSRSPENAAKSNSNTASTNDSCPHLFSPKPVETCPHCSLKFCSDCAIVHKEKLKDQIILLKQALPHLLETALINVEETKNSALSHLKIELSNLVDDVASESKLLAEAVCTAVAKRQARLVRFANEAVEKRREVVLKIVQAVEDAKLPETETVSATSVLYTKLEDIADVYTKLSVIEKNIDCFNNLAKNVGENGGTLKSNQSKETVDSLKETFLKEIDSCLAKIDVQWLEPDELRKQWLDKLANDFHEAVKKGDLKKVKEVVVAAKKDSPSTLSQLLENSTIGDPKLPPFLKAVYYGQLSIMEYFVSELQLRYLYEQVSPKRKSTALHLAASNGNFNVAEFLLRTQKNLITKRLSDQSTPLHLAAASGHPSLVELLLDRGADASSKNVNGHMPIHLACAHGHAAIVQILVPFHPELMQRDHQLARMLIAIARRYKRVEVLNVLNTMLPQPSCFLEFAENLNRSIETFVERLIHLAS